MRAIATFLLCYYQIFQIASKHVVLFVLYPENIVHIQKEVYLQYAVLDSLLH